MLQKKVRANADIVEDVHVAAPRAQKFVRQHPFPGLQRQMIGIV